MAITNGYATRDELDEYLGDSRGRDGDLKDRVIEAASRSIDAWTGRRFYLDTVPSARLFPAVWGNRLDLRTDFVSIDSIAPETSYGVLGGPYDPGLYRPGPYDNPSIDWPYQWIEGAFTGWGRTVSVTATWGWPSVPASVTQACLIKSARVYKRKESPTGVQGLDEFGPIRVSREVDADMADLLAPFRLLLVA